MTVMCLKSIRVKIIQISIAQNHRNELKVTISILSS